MFPIREFFIKLGPEILSHTYEHIYLTFIGLVVAIVIALPLGIYLTRTRCAKLVSFIMGCANIIQTIPSLALIALIVAFLILINQLLGGKEWYRTGGTFPTIGILPALSALVLYALLPILRNTYTGIRQVDSTIIEVATGMGMSKNQILFMVEIPLSVPVIMAGIRISAVWTIGIATLCALVGAGGLGDLIMQGLRSNRIDYLLAGTIPAAILALIFDGILGLLEKYLTPKGLQG